MTENFVFAKNGLHEKPSAFFEKINYFRHDKTSTCTKQKIQSLNSFTSYYCPVTDINMTVCFMYGGQFVSFLPIKAEKLGVGPAHIKSLQAHGVMHYNKR